MKITKIGHCCLLVEENNLKILTDPGVFTVEQNSITGIDIVLITHEHADHLHADSVKEIVKNNPGVKIVTNSSCGKILEEIGVSYEVLEGKDTKEFNGINLEAFDAKHEEIFEDFGIVQNTGYFIGERLFYPGDAYGKPGKDIDILALPVAGPWCKIADSIRYALEVKPKKAFPVHDAMLNSSGIAGQHAHADRELKARGIEFTSMKEGDVREF